MAAYTNNSVLGVLDPNTPDQTLQSYAQHGQSLLDAQMPGTIYSPWQAIANALGKFQGRNEIDSAARANMNKTYAANHGMNTPNHAAVLDHIAGMDLPDLSSVVNSRYGDGSTQSAPTSRNTQQASNVEPTQNAPVSGDIPSSGASPYVNKLIQIESGGNPHAVTKSGTYKGLGQFGPSEERRYGINDQNRTDPNVQIAAINKERQDIDAGLAPKLGRMPTDGEAYLAHQQGVAGAAAHINNPDSPAWKTIRPYYNSDAMAMQVIRGNLPRSMQPNADTITSGQFAHLYTSKFDGDSGGQTNVAQAQPSPTDPTIDPKDVQQASAQPGQSPITTGSVDRIPPEIMAQAQGFEQPQQGVPGGIQVAQNVVGGNQLRGNQQGPPRGSFLDHVEQGAPPSEPQYSETEMNTLANLPKDKQDLYREQRKQAWTPTFTDIGIGSIWKLGNRVGFEPKVDVKQTSIGDVQLPNAVALDPTTGGMRSDILFPGQSQGGAAQQGGAQQGGAAQGVAQPQGGGQLQQQPQVGGTVGPPNPVVPGQTNAGTGTPPVSSGNQQLDQMFQLQHAADANKAQSAAMTAGATAAAGEAAKVRIGPIQDAVDTAKSSVKEMRLLDALDSIDSLPDTADIHTGPFADKWLEMQKTINDLHPGTFNTAAITSAEGIKKLGTQIASLQARELTSRPSQFDFGTFISSSPGLELSPEGRRTLTSLYRAVAQQDVAVGRLANRYADNPTQFEDVRDQYYKDHPITVKSQDATGESHNYRFQYGQPAQEENEDGVYQKMQPKQTAPKSKFGTYDPIKKAWSTP